MPDKKISQLAPAAGIDGDELIPVVQDGANASAIARQISQRRKHGFDGRSGSSMLWDPVDYEFVLLCTDQDIWLNGQRYSVVSEALTVPIGDPGPPAVAPAAGTWFVVVQDDGAGALELVASQDVWSIDDVTYTPVATLFWNGTTFAIQEERHDAERNLALHEYLHKTVGARIQNDGSFAQTRPSTANDGQIQLAGGSLWDEDIENPITTAQGKLVRNWHETASGTWTWADGTANSGYDRPYLWNSGTSRLQYPLTTNSYTLTDCADNRYIPVWVYASNDIDRPIYVVTPALATTYTTVANARAATAPVLPFAPELKLLYRWIYRGDGEYQEAADYRTASSLPSGGLSIPVAASIAFAPSGNIAATDVQAMGQELDDEKLAKSGGTLTNVKETRYAVTTSGNVTIDLANGNLQRFILDAARQFTLPADPGDVGQSFTLIIECATYTPTWNSSPAIKWLTVDNTAPTLTVTADKVNVLTFIWDDTDSRWLGFLAGVEL